MTSDHVLVSASTASEAIGSTSIWTPEIERMAQAVVRWVLLDMPGAAIVGTQRAGKTWAIRYMGDSLAAYFSQQIAFAMFTITENLPTREGALLADLLVQIGIAPGSRPAKSKKRLLEYLEELLANARAQRIVTVLDEAQWLGREHLGVVMGLHNLLERRGFRPFFLLIGQPELGASLDSYVAMNELQVTGRFFERVHRFRPIALKDIEGVLQALETDVQDQGQVQPSNLAQLFPEAWEKGWRPSMWADSIKQGLLALAKRAQLTREPRLPMMHFRALIISGIHAMLTNQEPLRELPQKLIATTFRELGLDKAIVWYARAENDDSKKKKNA